MPPSIATLSYHPLTTRTENEASMHQQAIEEVLKGLNGGVTYVICMRLKMPQEATFFAAAKKNLKRDALRFFNIHFVTNYQKNSRRPLATSKNSHKAEKGRFIESKKVEKCDTFALDSFLFHVRCFRCVQNEVISTYGKSA